MLAMRVPPLALALTLAVPSVVLAEPGPEGEVPVAPTPPEPPEPPPQGFAPVPPAPPEPPAAEPPWRADDPMTGKKARKAQRERDTDITVGGRVFVREQLASVDDAPWTSQLALASARLWADLRYQKWLRVVVEIELRNGEGRLRDAFLRLDAPHDLRVTAGQFKMAPSLAENASAWELPQVDRGLLSSILTDGLVLAGRAQGVSLAWRPDVFLSPQLELGAFQGQDVEGEPAQAPVDEQEGALTVAGRADLEPVKDLRVGVWGSSRSIAVSDTARARFWGAGLDVQGDFELGCFGLRFWLDVLAASSQRDPSPIDTPEPVLLGARGIVAGRLGGAHDGDAYAELFASGSFLDPSRDDEDDQVHELAVGVNGGAWDLWRVQVQLTLTGAGVRTPLSLDGGTERVEDALAVTFQVGAKL
jgi:hypothetical protein